MSSEPANLLAASEFAEAINIDLGEAHDQYTFGTAKEMGVNMWVQEIKTPQQVFTIMITARDL